MAIFSGFRRLLAAIEELVLAIHRLAQVQDESGPATNRLEALELSRHQFEAQMEGLYLKAEGKLKAASNSEARERQLKKSHEANLDDLGEDGGAGSGASPILPDDAPPSEEERVPALRLAVAPSPKAAALNHKWGTR